MRRHLSRAAALAAAAALGAGGGAVTVAALSSDAPAPVRQVTVTSAQPVAATAPLSVAQVYQRAHKSVVEVSVTSSTPTPWGSSEQQQGQGSGFVYDSAGRIVTNEHVVGGASSVSVRFWNGATSKATVVGTDPSTDLAVLKVSAPASLLVPLPLGDSDALVVGEGVVAIGSPFGLEDTVTSGIVSALGRQIQAPNNFTINGAIQTDAAINPGNSGGPLLDLEGKVIGVNAQIESQSGGNDGVGFAIPATTVKSIVPRLIANGSVEHAYLGVGVEDAAAGVRITLVRAGTPAAAAGLRTGDVVTAIDGKKVATASALQTAIDAKSPGDAVTLTYTRGGNSATVRVTLATRPA